MSSESVSPVVNAPSCVAEAFDEEFIDNYEMLTGNNDQYSLSEKMVHYCGGAILPVHWCACKAVLAFHAGSGVSKLKTTTKADREAACLELYYNTIESLDDTHFDKASRDYFCNSFQKKEEPMPAHSLYRYYHDSRASVRNQVLPFFPKELVTMKSGRGFHETCNDVYIKAYRKEMSTIVKNGTPKYSEEDIADMIPPQHWEFTKKPWYFGLLVKIFRRDPQLALHVASVMDDTTNRPISRAAMRREKQHLTERRRRAISNISSTGTSSPTDDSCLTSFSDATGSRNAVTIPTTTSNSGDATATTDQKQLLWAKMLASKAHAEATNIAKRMGKMEELEKGMALLEKMRPVIGESTYAKRVQSLFAALPNFEGFDAAVDIIHVDSTPPTNKRHRSLEKCDGCTTTKKANNSEVITTANDDDDDKEDESEDDEQEECNNEDCYV